MRSLRVTCLGSLLAGLLLGSLISPLLGALDANAQGSAPPAVVRAQSFELVDDAGRPILTLSPMAQGWPGVGLSWKGDERAFASLTLPPDGGVAMSVGDAPHCVSGGFAISSEGKASSSWELSSKCPKESE